MRPLPFAVDSADAVVLVPLELLQEDCHPRLRPFGAMNEAGSASTLAIDHFIYAYIPDVLRRLPRLRPTSGLPDLAVELVLSSSSVSA
ncbi:hypothetical protein D1007_38189 [Hordeum vulgare]|nr:hypothetical protein D1007_38189 [Hordeum vulgare]